MKFSSGVVYDTIRKDYLNTVQPIVTAEWNLNRYCNPTTDNTPAEDTNAYDIELFPITSVIEPIRPKAGILKAVTDQAVVAARYRDVVPTTRSYMASKLDKYKYWQSPVPTAATTPYNFPNHTDSISMVRPRVEYRTSAGVSTLVTTNKIRITVENTFASPDDWDVQVKNTVAGAWTTIATNPAMGSDGVVELYWNGTTWTSTRTLGFSRQIFAVQLVVRSMNKSSYFNLIELGARLEADLSPDVSAISDSMSLGDVDYVTPMGTVSSNTGQVTLVNDAGLYSNSNPSSPYYNMLDKNVKFKAWYRYNGTTDVQQFEMFTDKWTESPGETVVDLTDFSKFLMEAKPAAVMYQKVPVQEAAWRVLDTVGFSNFVVTTVSTLAHDIINIFWTTGEDTVWDVLQSLSRAAQCAFYFDSQGRLQIRTRDGAFNNTRPVDWTARKVASGVELPDIITLDNQADYESNKVTVSYQPTGFSDPIDNVYPFEIVWQPEEDTLAVRASDLTQDLLVGGTNIWLSADDASIWPWKGACQIEGEWIRYEGKEYLYYDGAGVRRSSIVKSLADQQRLDYQSIATAKYLNKYSGKLVVTERGAWNTAEQDHKVNIDLTGGTSGWTFEKVKAYVNHYTSPAPAGFSQQVGRSTVTLQGNAADGDKSYLYLHRGNAVDGGYRRIGTRMKIYNQGTTREAGIFINGATVGSGYFISIKPSDTMTPAVRKMRNEVQLYSMKSNGTKKSFGGQIGTVKNKGVNHGRAYKVAKGGQHQITAGEWFNVDVHFFNTLAGDHQIKVFVDGEVCINTTITAASGWQSPWISRLGPFVRGYSAAAYEYVYGVNKADTDFDDETNYYNVITGSYLGSQWFRDFVYETRTINVKVKKKTTQVTQKYQTRFMDEFGPYAHEIREMDVKFDAEKPVLQTKLFNTNDAQVICTEYRSNPFGAHFVLANAARVNAIAHGDDELTAGSDNPITQDLWVYGRPVIQKDALTVERRDEDGIRRRGLIETTYDSKWIQNESAAVALADWLTTHWTKSDSTLSVEVFGNPLIELCDIVAVEYDDLHASTHQYYVVATSTSFGEGALTTTLTLRRMTP